MVRREQEAQRHLQHEERQMAEPWHRKMQREDAFSSRAPHVPLPPNVASGALTVQEAQHHLSNNIPVADNR